MGKSRAEAPWHRETCLLAGYSCVNPRPQYKTHPEAHAQTNIAAHDLEGGGLRLPGSGHMLASPKLTHSSPTLWVYAHSLSPAMDPGTETFNSRRSTVFNARRDFIHIPGRIASSATMSGQVRGPQVYRPASLAHLQGAHTKVQTTASVQCLRLQE
ncbi:hypothetical protein ACJQWK_01137 [Exserohilum turcicum]|uniref:Uncharacterized protein n=1 Tax=Exserohilum turcicum (strain 28A) TaxID=671987 RepID=R0K3X4_EXST2|nr:uncharacterized protein SETTUDRAFT_42916 [Exserohilum turcica Et28A]EOA84274.1 hypothetical protein SETTUDRAFT_42916 [Exserohilum turcica Et28A]